PLSASPPPPPPHLPPLSLHDALPISAECFPLTSAGAARWSSSEPAATTPSTSPSTAPMPPSSTRPSMVHRRNTTSPTSNASGFRSEEHTSELQSRSDLVCRLLLEKKK